MSGISTEGYPLHRLNTATARSWLLIPAARNQMAGWLGKNYKTGVVVLTPELRAFALVSPFGRITALKWPYRKFEFHQISNKPSAIYRECACRNFYDPESGEAWGNRDKERHADIHHPHCQGREVAAVAWQQNYDSAVARAKEGYDPQKRPDEWIQTAKSLEGTSEIRSR
jgi:hypothetical protein